MTDQELRDQAVKELKLTTVGFINSKWTVPPAGTHWKTALDLLARIGATSFSLKVMYGPSASQTWSDIQPKTGCNTIIGGADDSAALQTLRAAGGKMWAKAGYWDDGAGGFSMGDTQALALAKMTAANWSDVVIGWYVADEPTNNAANRAAVQRRAQLLKSGFPVETLLAYYDAGSLSQWKGVVDAFALDIYPSRFNWNMDLITQLAAAADQAGLRYYGIVGCDGAPNYPMPTPAQLQTMIDRWKATKQSGWGVYAWDSPGQLKNRNDLLAVLKANS